MCSIQCEVCSEQYAVLSVQCAGYSIQCKVCSEQYAVYEGLSKHQEVSSTPMTKVKKLIVVFGTFLVQ